MKRSTIAIASAVLFLAIGTMVWADHHEGSQGGEGGMPPMGPPAEMKLVEGMNGEYAVKFLYKMDPASPEWLESDATAVLSSVVGGGAQLMEFEGEMMGMPFQGMGMTTYDRATQKWQTTWVDSMGARISVYTGDFEDGKMVVTGKDIGPTGETFHSRLTTYNITEDGWDWKYEMSMDGTNFVEGAKATYTRK